MSPPSKGLVYGYKSEDEGKPHRRKEIQSRAGLKPEA